MNDEKKSLDPQENTPAPEETPAAGPAPEEAKEGAAPKAAQAAPAGKKGKGGMKRFLHSSKFRHGGLATVFTAGFLAVIILVNLVVSLLGERFPSMNLDLTANAVNTLSEEAEEAVDAVSMPTTITILLDEDTASTNAAYSQVTNIVERMRERNGNITVRYQDLDADPTFSTNYPDATLATGDVIVETERRYRVLSYSSDLFETTYDYSTGASQTVSYVNSALASALNQANATDLPVVAFATGHSEALTTSSLQELLSRNNFDVVSFNIMTEEIPEDTSVVVVGTPTTDYTLAEIEKLDAFLSEFENTRAASRAVLCTFDPGQPDLPNLNTFLEEWGLGVSQDVVYEQNTQNLFMPMPGAIVIEADDEVDFGSSSTYDMLVTMNSIPVEMLFDNSNSVVTYPLLHSMETACLVNSENVDLYNTQDPSASEIVTDEYSVAAMGSKSIHMDDGEYYTASVIGMGSSMMFDPAILDTNTFNNAQYVIDLFKYVSDTSESDTAVYSSGTQMYVMDINMSMQTANVLGVGIFTVLPLAALLIAGVVVYLRRRHL